MKKIIGIYKKRKTLYNISLALLAITISFSAIIISIPDNLSVVSGRNIEYNGISSVFVSFDSITASTVNADEGEPYINADATAKLFGIIPVKNTSLKVYKNKKLLVGGIPIGIKMEADGIKVSELLTVNGALGNICPAENCGILQGDIITEINGNTVKGKNEICKTIENSDGKEIEITVKRKGEFLKFNVTPIEDADGKYKIGVGLKDGTTGIGTLTYVDPQTLDYGGVGHGIIDTKTGNPVEFKSGYSLGVNIKGINKSEAGNAGEIIGTFTKEITGKVYKNLNAGIYGRFFNIPDGLPFDEPIEIGLKNEVTTGEAEIYTSIDGNGVKKYKIEISKINNDESSNKSFYITITDKDLLNKTGGIIQGMSGSPIIQNGRLIGAITHVLINEPSKGYGISIEKMLAENSAQNATAQNAA